MTARLNANQSAVVNGGGHVAAQIVPRFANQEQRDGLGLAQDGFLRHSRGLIRENFSNEKLVFGFLS
jgi:hypothetical protein